MDSSHPDGLEKFFQCCPALLFIADLDGVIVKRSRALSDALGLGPDERVTLADLAHPDDRNAIVGGWQALASNDEPASIEVRLRSAGGAYRTYICSARRSADGAEVTGALRPTNDEGELSLEATVFREILRHVPASVWAVDKRGMFTFHEGKGLEAFNLKPGQLLGMDVFELYANTSGIPDIRKAYEGESSHSFNEQGDILNTENWYFPVRSRSGEITGAAGFTIDVSESKRIERELTAKIELIQQQQSVIRSLSTPIIQVWDNVLTLPMLGAVSSQRTAEVMDSLLSEIVSTRARYAILDLTGVQHMDTATAGHLVSLVRAIRLLGAEGIITGIQPAIAQTLAGLGVELAGIVTLSNLREGLRYCMRGMAR